MRLIDADALMKHIKDVPTWQDCDEYYWVATKYPHGMYDPEDIVSSIENTPTIDAVEVVHGTWESYPSHLYRRCSACKVEYDVQRFNVRARYCPNCGAKMDGGLNHETD